MSNVRDERNDSNHFFNVLKKPLDLSRGRWMVGVKKVIYHNTAMSIIDESITYWDRAKLRSDAHVIKKGKEQKWQKFANVKFWYGRTKDNNVELWLEDRLDMMEVQLFIDSNKAGHDPATPVVHEKYEEITDLPFKKTIGPIPDHATQYIIQFNYVSDSHTVAIRPGHYDSLNDLLVTINNSLGTSNIEFMNHEDRSYLKVNQDHVARLRLNNDLNITLGFDWREFSGHISWASHKPQLQRGRFAMFLYSNIVEYSLVGDVQVPLLGVFSFPRQKFGDIITIDVVQPMYRFVSTKQINEIEILCCSDSGEPIPFNEAKTLVELHFINRDV